MVSDRLEISEKKPCSPNGNSYGGIGTIDIGRAEDLRPFEVSILDLRMQRILYFGEHGPRRLIKPLVNDLRRRLLSLNGKFLLEDLQDYQDEKGAWKVLYTAPSTEDPNRNLCLLIRPDIKDAKGKICRIAPEEKVMRYRQGQTRRDRNSQKVLAASGIR